MFLEPLASMVLCPSKATAEHYERACQKITCGPDGIEYKPVSDYLKIFQALVELTVGQIELSLILGVLISGWDWLFLLQLATIEIRILLELLILLRYRKDRVSMRKAAGSNVL